MKKAVFVCLVLLAACSKERTQPDMIPPDNVQAADGENTEISLIEERNEPVPQETVNPIVRAGEEKLQSFGTVCNSTITDDAVNVRLLPSLKAEVLFQVHKDAKVVIIGVSKEIDTIDSYTGNWLNIALETYWGNSGWVFSKYVETGSIAVSELRITGFTPPQQAGRQPRLTASYQINGTEIMVNLYPHKEENQDFITFAYDLDLSTFHYSCIPGSYAWYPETNELKHISYWGTNAESAWTICTDDFKYIMEDFGTSPGPRVIGIRRVEDLKRVFSGYYYRDINLRGYTITVVYPYTEFYISLNVLDDELLDYAKEYRENNPPPNNGMQLLVVCEFNMDTGERRIIDGQYIAVQ